MARQMGRTSSPAHSAHRQPRAARVHARLPGMHSAPSVRSGPATVAIASLIFLLAAMLFLALQMRAIFSDQLRQEYIALVLEAVGRSRVAAVSVVQTKKPSDGVGVSADEPDAARADLVARLTALSTLVASSPFEPAYIPRPIRLRDASPSEIDALLERVSAQWQERREQTASDLRMRISRVADTLIVITVSVLGALVTALFMYTRRIRQLWDESHAFRREAMHDEMTGLPNRRKLLQALEEAAAVAPHDAPAPRIAVLYVDLDGFKSINDTRGHRAGDEFLTAVAERFRRAVRTTDVVARIGGDEFAVLVHEFSSKTQLAAIAQRLVTCVDEVAQERAISGVGASIGIAGFPDAVDDYRCLLAAADEAMYHVKRTGKHRYAFASA